MEVPDGPIDVADLVERFHEAYERRYGNRFPYIPVQGVSYRVELRVPSEKVEFAPLERRRAMRRRAAPARSSSAISPTSRSRPPSTTRELAAGRRAHRRARP